MACDQKFGFFVLNLQFNQWIILGKSLNISDPGLLSNKMRILSTSSSPLYPKIIRLRYIMDKLYRNHRQEEERCFRRKKIHQFLNNVLQLIWVIIFTDTQIC